MTNKPIAVTPKEIKEIASLQDLQDMWGAENASDMEITLKDIYTVKFDFMNESPGYVGDLFLIQPGYLDGHVPVTRLIRNREKRLEVLK